MSFRFVVQSKHSHLNWSNYLVFFSVSKTQLLFLAPTWFKLQGQKKNSNKNWNFIFLGFPNLALLSLEIQKLKIFHMVIWNYEADQGRIFYFLQEGGEFSKWKNKTIIKRF